MSNAAAFDMPHIPRIFKKGQPEPQDMDEFMARPLKYLNPDLLPEQVREHVKDDVDRKLPRHGPIRVFGGECNLEILERVDYDDYFAVTKGFFYGLIEGPGYDVQDCSSCITIANSIGSIQENVVAINASRVLW